MCANLRLDILEEHIEGGHPLCSRAAKGRVTLQSLGGGVNKINSLVGVVKLQGVVLMTYLFEERQIIFFLRALDVSNY